MVTRRRTLRLGAAILAAASGCLSRQSGRRTASPETTPSPHETPTRTPGDPSSGTPDDTATDTPDDVPTRTPDDPPEWGPAWTMPFDGWSVLGLTSDEERLYATLSTNGGPSAVAAVDPSGQEVLWQTESEGEAVFGSHSSFQQIARGQWGVTVTDERVYVVAGFVDEREWSAVHALERETGDRRWSVRRERGLSVVGTADGTVVATGLEFFPSPGETPAPTHTTPESPLSTAIYALDAADGTVRWTREFDDVQDVAVRNGVYVGAGERLVGLDFDGSERFTYEQGPPTQVVASDDRVVYLTGDDETATLHGLAPSGDREWRRSVPVRELLLDGDRLYAGGGTVAALSGNGRMVWRHDHHGQWLLLAPGRGRLYTRSGIRMDSATAYDAEGGASWRFDPPSNNAWPAAATQDAVAVEAITPDGDGPDRTLYAVDADGHATAALGRETFFDALGLDGRIYVGDGQSTLVALEL